MFSLGIERPSASERSRRRLPFPVAFVVLGIVAVLD
jgi:hypothetical protein